MVLLREHSGPLRIFGAGEPAQRLGMLVFTEGPGVVLITHVAPHNSGPPVPEALKPLLASLGTRHSMIYRERQTLIQIKINDFLKKKALIKE